MAKTDKKLIKELKGDVKHLTKKAEALVDQLVQVQDVLHRAKWRLYVLTHG